MKKNAYHTIFIYENCMIGIFYKKKFKIIFLMARKLQKGQVDQKCSLIFLKHFLNFVLFFYGKNFFHGLQI